jgi:2-amino-4-hydroxy-6-hydroxymethyldihydropteridine diphosphokinase
MQTAYIAMGANLASWAGPPEVTMAAAASQMANLGRVRRRSSLYSTEPVGLKGQPRFLNAVIELETDLKPRDLLERLLSIEKEYGRDRVTAVPNGPRTLDLDILLYGDFQVSEPGLEIPHPRAAERGFVLVPLNEIAPKLIIPGHSGTVTQLLQKLLRNRKDDTDAVVRVESDAWRAGAAVDTPDSVAHLRPGGA